MQTSQTRTSVAGLSAPGKTAVWWVSHSRRAPPGHPVWDHSTIMWKDLYGGGTLAEDDIDISKGTTSRRYFGDERGRKGGEWVELEWNAQGLSLWERIRMEVGVTVAPSTQLKKSGEGGCIKSDGVGADDEDGGRGESDLEITYRAGCCWHWRRHRVLRCPRRERIPSTRTCRQKYPLRVLHAPVAAPPRART